MSATPNPTNPPSNPPSAPPSTPVSLQDYQSTLREEQLQLQETQDRLKILQLSSAPQSRAASPAVSDSVSSATEASGKKDPWVTTATQLGKQFSMTGQPWPPPFADIHGERPPFSPLDPVRYTTPGNVALGTRAEIWSLLPTKEHEGMVQSGYPKWITAFSQGMSQQRNAAVSSLKSVAHLIYSDYSDDFFSRNDTTPREAPAIQALLGAQPGNDDKLHLLLPPLIYPNHSVRRNHQFRALGMMKLTKVTLFGPTSIKSNSLPTKKTVGQIWGLKTTPPGLIAFTAIFARFLFSCDREFRQTGALSRITYEADFHAYKRLIISTIDNEHTKKTLCGILISSAPNHKLVPILLYR
ncbi:hypothetical protein AAF712_009166 [Marasmius tenuissimus]|uniref:Uncharacterized protein n=1 Tax=Marasmius tenuissimus TaxID=585030 RepID=A0ABR2ZQD6_9AGAR